MGCHMAWGKVGVLLHHLDGFPAAELLQNHQRRTVLHMPTCPGMAQIVPAEVFDTSNIAGALEVARVMLLNE